MSAAAALLLPAHAAGAQVLDDTIDDVTDLVSPLPSPDVDDPGDDVTGTLNDTVKNLTDAGGGGGSGGADGGGGGGGTTRPGSKEGASLHTSGTTGSPNVKVGRDGGGTGRTGAQVSGPAGDGAEDYATLARRGAGAAIARAMRMAGPFAAPILLAGLALIIAGSASRGSRRLVRLDRAGNLTRSYRL